MEGGGFKDRSKTSMQIWDRHICCAICGEPLRSDRGTLMGFGVGNHAGELIWQVLDAIVHDGCLPKATLEQRTKYAEAWNRIYRVAIGGDFYRVEADGRLVHTELAWEKVLSPEAKRQMAEAEARRQEELARPGRELETRIEWVRRMAIERGLASAGDVDRVIREMPVEEFRRLFGELRVSRAFFKNGI